MKMVDKIFFIFLCLFCGCIVCGCINNQSSNANQSRDMGDDLYNQGKYEEALKYYEKSIESNPNDPDVHHQKTMCLLNLGKIPESIQSIDRELELNQGADRDFTCRLLIAKIELLLNLNQTEEAKQPLQEYLQLDPNDELGYLKKSRINYTTVTPTQTPTPKPTYTVPVTPKPSPKYVNGDVVDDAPISRYTSAEIILNYDPNLDKYASSFISYNTIDKGWYGVSESSYWRSRTLFEEENQYKIGHVDLSKLKTLDGKAVSIPTTPYPTITYPLENEDGKIEYGNYIKVEYYNDWSGSITTTGSVKSVDGYGTQKFYVGMGKDIGSGCFIKKDNSRDSLLVEVIKDGHITRMESSSTPYGMVCVTT